MNKAQALGEDRISSLLRSYSVPAIIGMVVNALYNVVDSVFVGQGVGEVGLTAVTIAFPLMSVLMAVGMLVGLGAAALVSIRLGKQDKAGAELILGNAFTMISGFVLVTTGVALYFLDPLLLLLGATPEVLPYARDFSFIILAGSVFMHISFGLNGIIRAQGDPRTALLTMLIAAILNMIFNPLFIFGFGMGIKGSAWATVLAQAISTAWVMVYFIRGSGTLTLRRRCLAVDGKILAGITRIGMAPFLMQIGNSLVMVIFNFTLLAHGGTSAVAAFGIINRMLMLLLMPIIGISQGAQPIIGYNYGAGQYKRVIETVKTAVLAATVLCLLGFTSVQLFAEQIIRLFNGNPELVHLGATGLRLFLAMLPVIGFQMISANYFQAVGKAGYAIVFNLLRQIIILIPMVYLLPQFLGLIGIWLAGPISDMGAALLTGIVMVREIKHLSLQEQADKS
ncbi:MATE family efflux transporter [Acetonema longum]|uniref:Multidrug export protein MepA n=1 Tax=Acetonema longum DSM 6540 TaxID=1009370 RepID=F7NJ89_9FIRM|nr:MATE family efflux transporter [Acetonema longum]EGO63837.1 MATE efflux family protein [Acetonema longum DSM 6540]